MRKFLGGGNCKAIPQFWDATEGSKDNPNKRTLKIEYLGRLAFAIGVNYYETELKTLPEFGCVQHESI